MIKLEQAARQIIVDWDSGIHLHEAITAMREALAEQSYDEAHGISSYHLKEAEQAEHDLDTCPGCGCVADNGHDREFPPNPYYCTKCTEQAEQEPVAWMQKASIEWVKHPHNERNQTQVIVTGVKVFDGQVPLYAAPVQQAEQEPVAWLNESEGVDMYAFSWRRKDGFETPLYAAPVRTKDLTDDEIDLVCKSVPYALAKENIGVYDRGIARAVIAADREKNK